MIVHKLGPLTRWCLSTNHQGLWRTPDEVVKVHTLDYRASPSKVSVYEAACRRGDKEIALISTFMDAPTRPGGRSKAHNLGDISRPVPSTVAIFFDA